MTLEDRDGQCVELVGEHKKLDGKDKNPPLYVIIWMVFPIATDVASSTGSLCSVFVCLAILHLL